MESERRPEVTIGEPRRIPEVHAGGRAPQIVAMLPDSEYAGLVELWREAVNDGSEAVRIYCADCTGTRRGILGIVYRSGVWEWEIVAPPRTPRPGRVLPAPFARQMPGWHRRGEPDAPIRAGYLWNWSLDGYVRWAYCARHGGRIAPWHDIAVAFLEAVDSEKVVRLGV